MKKKVYIAGPMRSNSANKYENYNFDAFDKAEKLLRDLGMIPISPAAMDRLFEGYGKYPPTEETSEHKVYDQHSLLRFISRDLNAIGYCDAIYMLEGWQHSKGAGVELALARFLQLELIFEVD
jgi:hypothetical protein